MADQESTGRYLHASLPLFHSSSALDELARLDLRGLRTWTTPSPDEESRTTKGEGDSQETSRVWQLWLGGGGVMSALHYDQTHNIFVQLHGAPDIQSLGYNCWLRHYIALTHRGCHQARSDSCCHLLALHAPQLCSPESTPATGTLCLTLLAGPTRQRREAFRRRNRRPTRWMCLRLCLSLGTYSTSRPGGCACPCRTVSQDASSLTFDRISIEFACGCCCQSSRRGC